MITAPLHGWTPTLDSLPLGLPFNKKIYLKMEAYQPCGSYKIRGIGRLCQYWSYNGKRQFVSSSGGNAGYTVAYLGKLLNIAVTVFLPKNAKAIYKDAIKAQGAIIYTYGETWDEADIAAREYTEKKPQAAYIPPFDHPLIWSGHATIIDEVAQSGLKPDAVVVPVGGGGLACGILEGMHRQGWHNTPLFTVETEGAASFAASVAANQLITLEKIDTIATTLGVKKVCNKLWEWRQQHSIIPLIVSDKSALYACQRFLDDHRVLVEPSSGVALAVIYEQHHILADYQSILVIVSGGIGISLKLLYNQDNLNH